MAKQTWPCLLLTVVAVGCGVDEVAIDLSQSGKAEMGNALDDFPHSPMWTNQTLHCDQSRTGPLGDFHFRRGNNMDRVWVYRGQANASNIVSFTGRKGRGVYMRVYDSEQKPLLTGYCKPDDGAHFDSCIGDYSKDPTLQEDVLCDSNWIAQSITMTMLFKIPEGYTDRLLLQVGPICDYPQPDGKIPKYWLSARCLEEGHEDYTEPGFTVE